jgi:ubiquinone/menaquinone biosynthesis C-methylase UbiE
MSFSSIKKPESADLYAFDTSADASRDFDRIKKTEKEYHERYYYRDSPMKLMDLQQFRREHMSPCYTTGTERYSDNGMAFDELLRQQGGWTDKVILDYGCGLGKWAVYYALTGAKKVMGFDLAESGIRRGSDLVRRQGLADKVSLSVMDATNLGYPDNTFEMVIGQGVLHHVIKYPGIFEELYRVMKPGAKAYFHEGLADFPLFDLWWRLKGEVDQGDTPIHAEHVRRLAHRFSDVQIIGDTFLFSVKTFIWKPSIGKVGRFVLKTCKNLDNFLFRMYPPLRAWGAFSYIIITK